MATYVNDLRLKEIATGDESGTWGASTNTNLELIAEAFSFGTEAITTNADTHTTTIADGSTDPGRSLFLKYTGTLDSACTITIGPNTVSKLWLIENATSGSQNIIIKQGSGATVTVPNGQTKAIYSDGAGSGGAMVDAFQDLSIPDLFIDDDLTFTSDSAVITFGADGDTTLTHTDGSGLTLNGTNKLMFNDASQFIQGSSATVLSLGATDEIDLTATAIDINGTMDVSGAVTANAGVSIDNITIDGTEIDLSSGDLTIDVAGDIIFDADGGDFRFKDAGTQQFILDLDDSANSVILRSSTSDGDMIFQGNDGGSNITALTLDMSAAGKAIFNAGIVVNESGGDNNTRFEGENKTSLFEIDASTDRIGIGISSPNSMLHLFDGGSDTGITVQSQVAANATASVLLMSRDASNVNHNTTLTAAGGNFTVDTGGDIILDADGSTITMKDGGTTRFTFNLDATPDLVLAGGNASITASTQDADLSFIGNDGGSDITALFFDMSQAGRATFNEGIVAKTSTAGGFGLTLNTASGDSMKLQVTDTGTGGAAHGLISVSDGDLTLDVSGDIVFDADGGDFNFKDDGTTLLSLSNAGSNNVQFLTGISDGDLLFKGVDGGSVITALTLDMSAAGAATFNAGATLGGALSGTTASFSTSSTSDSVFTLTDTGVAAYEVIFPDTGTYQLQTNTSSDKTFKLFNQGTGTFLLDVEGSVSGTSLIATEGLLELDDNGTHNGVINVPASCRNSTGESFQVGVNATNISSSNILFKIDESGNTTVGDPTYGSSLGQLRVINDANATAPASLSLFGFGNVADGGEFAKIEFCMQISGTGGDVVAKIEGEAEGTNENAADLVFQTATGGSLNERMRISSVGVITKRLAASGTGMPGTSVTLADTNSVNGLSGSSNAGGLMLLSRDSGNLRSISAAGTINASGADYAEYMTKADGCGAIAKGDVVGVDVNGKLTDVFADAISFVIKSTDPSYVGGDNWMTPEQSDPDSSEYINPLSDEYNALRASQDRIAFSGQVPVNITGSFNVGDYVYPEADGSGIKAVAKSSPTFEEYQLCVGKIWATEEDGRPFVAVKIG